MATQAPKLEQFPNLDDLPADLIKEFFVEAQHSSWDGWEENDLGVLLQLLNDMVLYVKHCR
jgi:hypothetical protein